MNTQGITVSISVDFNFDVEDVWPDGDAPDLIRVADVVNVIRETGDVVTFLRDWSLDLQLDLDVAVSAPDGGWPDPPEPHPELDLGPEADPVAVVPPPPSGTGWEQFTLTSLNW